MADTPGPSSMACNTTAHPRDSRLGRLVEKTWLLSRRVCDSEGRFEVTPDGHFGMGIVLSKGSVQVVAGGPITQRFTAFMEDDEIYWLRFRPGRWPRIADVDPMNLIDAPGILLDHMHTIGLDVLAERMLETSCIRSRLELLDQHFQSLPEVRLYQDSRCCQILDMVDRLHGCLQVQDISREFGFSARTIERLLASQVGLTPGQLIRNVRLQRTIARLQDRTGHSLARIAHECGFADQSHMINEFQKWTGRLPSTF